CDDALLTHLDVYFLMGANGCSRQSSITLVNEYTHEMTKNGRIPRQDL
ncbi:unnamed protein product, partial [Rotaria magnacalcarata]